MNPVPPPTSDAISTARRLEPLWPSDKPDPLEGMVTPTWLRWFVTQAQTVNQAASQPVTPTSLVSQAASIGVTSIAPGLGAAGLYRLTYYARITKAAGVSSSLTITFGWTDHTVVMSASGAVMTGNTVTTFQTGTLLVYADSASTITYSTTYAANPANDMSYQLYVTLEAVGL